MEMPQPISKEPETQAATQDMVNIGLATAVRQQIAALAQSFIG